MIVDRKYHLSLLWRIRMCACETVQTSAYLFPFAERVWMCLFCVPVLVTGMPLCKCHHLESFSFCHFHPRHLLICGTTELLMKAFCSSASGNIVNITCCASHSCVLPSFSSLIPLIRTHIHSFPSFIISACPSLSFSLKVHAVAVFRVHALIPRCFAMTRLEVAVLPHSSRSCDEDRHPCSLEICTQFMISS